MRTVNPLPGAFGAEVHGLDLRRDHDEQTVRQLSEALYAHQLIVIRAQQLDERSYLRFGRLWGTPIPHVLDHMRILIPRRAADGASDLWLSRRRGPAAAPRGPGDAAP